MTQHATIGLTKLTQIKRKVGTSMVKDICLQIGSDQRCRIPGPRNSRCRHLLRANNKHGPTKQLNTVHHSTLKVYETYTKQ